MWRNKMKAYQLDSAKFCCYVKVDAAGLLIEAAPVFTKFIGQPLSNLTSWVSKKFKYCTLRELK